MIGRRVSVYGYQGEIEGIAPEWWEKNNTMVRLDRGGAIWVPMDCLVAMDGKGPLPLDELREKYAARRSQDEERSAFLRGEV